MKKKILLFLLLLIPFSVHAAEELTYDEAVNAVKQSIQAWYMRGSNRQYNSSKNTYSILRHPEDATSQDTGYSVCSGFTNDAWMEAFGFKATSDGIGGHTPAGSTNYCEEAREYLDTKGCTTSTTKTGCNGEYLVYYRHNADNKTYYYNPKGWSEDKVSTFSNFVTLLQPGDMLAYDGHVVIIYDLKYDSSGKAVDALFFESGTGGMAIKSKIDPTEVKLHQLFYYKSKKENNGLLDIRDAYMPYEGTTHWRWLSEYTAFVKDGKMNCSKGMCSITRAFYKGSNNKAVLNYDVEWPQQIKTSKARIELPGIYIQKTSSKYDNNSVVLGDTISYTIRIINNSNLAKDQSKKYGAFHVVETLPEGVTLVTSTIEDSPEGTYNEANRTLKWDVSSLKAGETILLKYKVKVDKNTNNLGKFIEAVGKVYGSNSANYITTGTVRHEIIRTTSATDQQYADCYNAQKSAGKKSLSLIQGTYECVYDSNLGFDFTKFSRSGDNLLDQMIVRPKENPSKGESNAIQLKKTGENKIYTDMVLNQYWGGLILTNYGNTDPNDTYYIIPRWRKTETSTYYGSFDRADTIMSGHFKQGDVLIYYFDKANTKTSLRYTNENGLYAFIYIDGSFVGVNGSGSTVRNAFTKDYYTENDLPLATKLYTGSTSLYDYANYQTLMGKDTYVIFRPEKVITEISSIRVKTPPTKTTYYQKQTLDITGGVITATNNDGTTQDLAMNAEGVTVSGYDSNTIGEQKVTVTYKGKSATFTVTVNELSISSISVKTNPNKMTYFVGEALDLTGGVIQIHYVDNSTKTISMSNSKVTVTGFNSNQSGDNTLTVTYSGKTTTFTVHIISVALSTVSIESYPNKLVYVVGEDLDLTGGKIQKTFNNGEKQTVPMTDSSVIASGYDKTHAGTQTITLSIDGKHVTFDVIVNNPPDPEITKTLDSISIYSVPNKVSYLIGEEISLTGGKIKAKYTKTIDGVSQEEYEILDMSQEGVSVTGFSSSTEGEKTITVHYSEKTATFTVIVSKAEATLKKIEVTKNPTKKKYIQFQEDLDPTGGEITATYSDGSTEVVPFTSDSITLLDFDNTVLGEQQIHVIYKGLDTTFSVTVYKTEEERDDDDSDSVIQSIEITHQPLKVTYVQGLDEFDVSGIELRVSYEDGEVRNVELADRPGEYTISGFDPDKTGEQIVTITYRGYDIQFKVTVVPDDTVISPPDTLARKSILVTIFSILLIVSGLVIIKTNTTKNNA